MLRALPLLPDPNLLVGLTEPDDAAVVRLNDELALVFTTDFFTPVVDSPRDFGRIAAANALSDVYAMGARPLTALNIAAFPSKTLPLTILGEILVGGAEMAREAGITIAGGHTVDDPEPKYGLAVVGTVHPDQIWRKGGARPGDALILTKPLGSGILSTALKRDRLTEEHPAVREMVRWMTTLNAGAAQVAREQHVTVHAATDITGYGLGGHLHEMLRASPGVAATLDASALPALPEALALAREGFLAGGTRANRDHLGEAYQPSPEVPDEYTWLAIDAQTSGGLLFAVPEREAELLLTHLQRDAALPFARIIGRVHEAPTPTIRLT